MQHMPIKQEEVDEALHNLHPNKTDWDAFERSNMERALYRFWSKRLAAWLQTRSMERAMMLGWEVEKAREV